MEAELTEVDKLYFPHHFQKRLPFDKVLGEHVSFFNNESEKVKNSIRCEFDVPYGFLPREKYDIIGIDLPDDSPILIHVHGGYWQVKEISQSNQAFMGKILHKHNIKIINLGYGLCPDISLKEILNEIAAGIQRCLEYAKRNKSRAVFLSGHSAGAHMIAYLFSNVITNLPTEEQNLIKAVFISCGIYDLTPLTKTVINQGLKLTEETAKELSPQYLNISTPEHIKFYVIVAEFDSPRFIEQGKMFYEKLKGNNIDAEYKVLKAIDHFNAIENIVDENFQVTRLIIKVIEESKK
ncbi:unnamed protein product [Ceutorhynchus assimilis]|uniref:Alpha/beta hydrolase fold-3 domain-containing protein n=1 Tax=Ceutorhynchus assimilis TaxID=467358 RepID=A0A9N9MSG2_9CUCU|nr:unnamed protein product [Ceutorhynchus assimilis]